MSAATAGYTPKRTQYPFGPAQTLLGLQFKSRSETLQIQNKWNTFENIENYDDIIYQQFQQGKRSNTYYVFVSNQERQDYFEGQRLHYKAYPTLPTSTFCPIRDRPMPNVATVTALPYYSNRDICAPQRYVPTASERAAENVDLAVYTYISSYNSVHVIQYDFQSDEEKLAYTRAQCRLNATSYGAL
jgi:hypothetical protein